MKRLPFTKYELFGALLIGVFFLLAAYLSTTYLEIIRNFLNTDSAWGPFVYITCATFATIIAPVSATPLVPIASAVWGPVPAALYSVIGWTIGAVSAFSLARKYGFKKIRKFIRLKKIQEYTSHIPDKNLFWSVVFMRLVLPVDLLSYALGLFSNMRITRYTIATMLGVTPFAFVFSYAVHLPVWAQLLVLFATGIIVMYGYLRMRTTVNFDTREENLLPKNE